ncbi:DNA helicase RecQ [Cyclobacterium xiamenense]|uniref:DNA helicase RecQ n=1 Tax=Cyclobacterium xiamenense TaxID=1297121 RepID=UPI0012B7B8B2|nr:DNA helicase RecQ [Cyclobacterium xiamenense]
MQPLEVLKQFYGYASFRGKQEAIIQQVLEKKDCIALMPTGAGKSVCYQVPAMILPGLTLVVSPLIALMKDQVDAMNELGIPAAFLNSTQDISEQRHISDGVFTGRVKLLYVAPERLFGGAYPLVDLLKKVELSLVAVDEAHCVSQWGHDFRPEYLKLGDLRGIFADTPFLALTATADQQTRKDIALGLKLTNPQWFISSFDRPNITYRVTLRSDAFGKLLDFLSARPTDSGIVYCLSRKSVEETAWKLNANGHAALPYHAGLAREVRQANQEKFIRDEVRIIVATVAFGMGIDKSNVRFVVHTNMPQNIESYYQETGRAGRDGLPGEALLFYSFGDSITLSRMLENAEDPTYVRHMKSKLNEMVQYCQSRECRRTFLLRYFGEDYPGECGNCDTCLQKNEKEDMTIYSQMLLSAVVRLDQKFGLGHVILVLRGSQAAKIASWQKTLSVFGIGKDRSEEFWKTLGQQLIAEGYLSQEDPLRPIVKLTQLAWEKLKQKEKIFLNMEKDELLQGVRENEKDERLLAKLKTVRFELARKQDVPPYIIFSDATLVEMARYYPTSKQALLQIHGVGNQKLEKYGDSFLNEIRGYLNDNPTVSGAGGSPKPKRTVKQTITSSINETLALLNQGNSLEEIVEKRGLARSTIEGHVLKLLASGDSSPEKWLADAQLQEIASAAAQLQTNLLNPLKAHFGEKYSYFELRVGLLASKAREEH